MSFFVDPQGSKKDPIQFVVLCFVDSDRVKVEKEDQDEKNFGF